MLLMDKFRNWYKDKVDISMDDVFLWPDATWCYREDRLECLHLSDDFVIIKAGTEPYEKFFDDIEEGVK